MDIPREQIDQFFQPLVGTPAAAEAFENRLSRVVVGEAHPPEYQYLPRSLPEDPYDRLEAGVTDAMMTSINAQLEALGQAPLGHPDSFRNSQTRYSLFSNGVSGVNKIVAALRALGGLYERNATVPQRLSNVQAAIVTVLDRVMGIAYSGREAALINLEAGRSGLDPSNEIDLQLLRRRTGLGRSPEALADFSHGFEAAPDADGQLVVSPRFGLFESRPARPCAAIPSRAVDAEGHPVSALGTFQHAIANVALAHIYPNRFEIVADA